jgi:hypothetical protein
MGYIALASEDELSEAVGRRLSREANLEVTLPLRKGGNGYLRSRLPNFCQLANHYPVVLLTDLDAGACAPALLSDWFNELERPANLVFRVAVREIEAWLIADREALADFLSVNVRHVTPQPETILDPKQALIGAALKAPRRLREELVAVQGSFAAQGIGYNRILGAFVETRWDPERAAARSPSLASARQRIFELAARLTP